MDSKCCANCHHYLKPEIPPGPVLLEADKPVVNGECRRFPPTIAVAVIGGTQATALTLVPQPRPDYFCHEHKPKEMAVE